MGAPKGNKFAEGNEGGRPTKLTPEVFEVLSQYIASCVDTVDESGKLSVSLPTVEGLARRLKVSRETVYAWGKENKEFSDILVAIRDEQAKRLIENGLAGKYNPAITKLMLSAKHGFVEKTDVTTDGKPIQGVEISIRK